MSLIPKQVIDKNGKHTTVYVKSGMNIEEHVRGDGTITQMLEIREEIIGGWEIAPEGYTGYGCPFCGTFYTAAQRDFQQSNNYQPCYECGEDFDCESSLIGVTQEAVKFFDDDTVRETEWYHATIRENWHEGAVQGRNVNDEFDERFSTIVHLGTLEAAMTRIQFFSLHNSKSGLPTNFQWIIHKVKLDSDVPIHAAVMDDDVIDEPKFVFQAQRSQNYESNGATRYVNRFESEGSISLAVNANKMTVTDTYKMNPDGTFDGIDDSEVTHSRPIPKGY
jgi:predicted RNA-binding Zn-ribbon protein involved in translation (DUF1610 family)